MHCPRCNSEKIVKNGSIHTGAQKFRCKECSRQFIESPKKKMISQETWKLVDKLLLEKLPIAGISRVTGVSKSWLQQYINKKYQDVPKEITENKKKGK